MSTPEIATAMIASKRVNIGEEVPPNRQLLSSGEYLLDADTVYCRAGQTSNYCFTTIDRILKYYEISCDDGTPTVRL